MCNATLGNNNPELDYFLNGSLLAKTREQHDLGITISTKLKFGNHCSKIASAAHRKAALLLKCLRYSDPQTMILAFISYVSPILEYGSPIWNPFQVGDIKP